MFEDRTIKAKEIKDELTEMGRYEYAHPEIGLQERISILVTDELEELGI